jgi:hypothetical protein
MTYLFIVVFSYMELHALHGFTYFLRLSCGNIAVSGCKLVKLNAREKNVHAGEKLEDFETHFRIKWC